MRCTTSIQIPEFTTGIFEPPKETINIRRIGHPDNNDCIHDVLVVFIATKKAKSTQIVGFYEHATVFRHEKERIVNGQHIPYLITALAKNGFLLDKNERGRSALSYPSSRKNRPGRAGSWFGDKDEDLKTRAKIIAFINEIILDRKASTVSPVNRDRLLSDSISPGSLVHSIQCAGFSNEVKKAATANSEGKCACCELHKSFTAEDGKMYLEVHHLIPKCKQSSFSGHNLNDAWNAIALCPNCHRLVHHAVFDEKRVVLEKLYGLKELDFISEGLSVSKTAFLSLYQGAKQSQRNPRKLCDDGTLK